MKAYLVTTGALFALLAVLHAWRMIVEWRPADPGFLVEVGIGVLAAGLSVWAWRLLGRGA
jgi:hypothetical protein